MSIPLSGTHFGLTAGDYRATIASVGADRSVLRRIVTANGVVLGAAGGVTGVVLGIAGAIVFMRVTDEGAWTQYPGLHLWWPLLVGIAGLYWHFVDIVWILIFTLVYLIPD